MAAAMCLSVAACGSDNGGSGDTAKDTYTVGICQLVQHDALDAATKGFRDALTEELGDKVEFVEQNAANLNPGRLLSALSYFTEIPIAFNLLTMPSTFASIFFSISSFL